jgi:signal peptidase I
LAGSTRATHLSPHGFLRDLVVVLAVSGAVVWSATQWIAIPWTVSGSSMDPTLRDGDRVIVDLVTLRRRPPRVGDIVVFAGPGADDLVKRVARDPSPGMDTLPPAVLPPESALEPTYVVLGDNPPESSDSRAFGRVPRHLIRGRVVWRYWPPSRLGPIE